MLSDHEWAQVAARVMDRTGLASAGDDLGVRWVAVRHAPDHIHLVATLARQDRGRPATWNDFYRVRDACRDAERRFGLRSTAPADRTAARRATRAETEQAIRRGWAEAPRITLRREVSTAAAGSGSGRRSSSPGWTRPGSWCASGTARPTRARSPDTRSGCGTTRPADGGVVWYGGGKLAADLTLPKLRARWANQTEETLHREIPRQVARGLLRHKVLDAAAHARDEAGFFARLRETGVLVRLRFSEVNPGQVTGYAVALVGHVGEDGGPAVVRRRTAGSGADLAATSSCVVPANERSRVEAGHTPVGWIGTRSALPARRSSGCRGRLEHARRSARGHPTGAADTAWAAADALHSAAWALHDPALQRAADAYDRAARSPYGRIPLHTRSGAQAACHRPAARTARQRQRRQHTGRRRAGGQSPRPGRRGDRASPGSAARSAGSGGQESGRASTPRPRPGQIPCCPNRLGSTARARRAGNWAAAARSDFPGPLRLDEVSLDDPPSPVTVPAPRPTVGSPRRAGPSP